MISDTIGYVTLINIAKVNDYYFGLFSIFIGFFLFYCFKKLIKNKINLINEKIERSLTSVDFTLLTNFFLITLLFYSALIFLKFEIIKSIFLSFLLSFTFFNKILFFFKNSKLIGILLAYLLLIFKLLSVTNFLFLIIILLIICSLILIIFKSEKFILLVLLIYFSNLYFGDFIISDAFHQAELFYAGVNLYKNGFFSIFPNIGYLEEVPALVLIKLVNLLSFDLISISLSSSRTLVNVILLSVLSAKINLNSKFSKLALVSLLFILPVFSHRTSLLISLIYALLIIDYENIKNINEIKKKTLFLILCSLPFILISLSPSYFSIILLAFALNIEKYLKVNIKNIFLYLSWFVILILFFPQFNEYLNVYSNLSSNFDQAFGIPLKLSNNFTKLVFLISISFTTFLILFSIENKKNNFILNFFQYFIIALSLYILIKYGLGRIDPNELRGRLLSLQICFIFILYYYLNDRIPKFLLLYPFVIFIFFISFNNLPKFINSDNLKVKNYSQKFLFLNDVNANTVKKINYYANGGQVILYTETEPALAYFVNNSFSPIFTTPYNTVGEDNQNRVINFLKEHKLAIIYIGHDFNTYDGVDVRYRVPLVFKYISEYYDYDLVDGNIYAVPKKSINNSVEKKISIFFDNFDLQKSVIYFNKHIKKNISYKKIIIPCETQFAGKYKIINQYNSFYAELNCGTNFIPEVFFVGKNTGYQKINN